MSTGRAPCGPLDDFGRCSSRFHDLRCAHGLGTEWMASGPHPETYAAHLANWSRAVELASTRATVYGDPDDDLSPGGVIPQATLELAHRLSSDLGLFDDAPYLGAPGFDDVSALRPPGMPVSVYDALGTGIGLGPPPQDQPSYPDIRELAERLQLR